MRRLALVALFGALALGACSDASHQEPSSTPAFDKGIPCPDTDFPLDAANALITQLYPEGTRHDSPRDDMLARAKDISQKWSRCKVADPQGKVAEFVADVISDFNAGNLTGGTSSETLVLVAQLVNTMYSGVGFGAGFPAPPLPELPSAGPDAGIGFFTPGQQLLVQTTVKDGAVLIPADGFTEPTVITAYLRPDLPNPFDGTGETVYPPFYEFTATNASGTHYLASGQAVVGFCVDETELDLTALNDPAIAHLAVAEGTNPGGFEVLNDASDPQYDALGLDCERYAPTPPVVGLLFGHGLSGFAHSVPGVAAHYLRTVATAVFLPRRAEAYFGKLGLGSLASSLSPFGVVDRATDQLQIGLDPSDAQYFAGALIDTCHDGCPPDVQLLDGGGAGLGAGINVTVSLVQVAGTGGVLSGTTMRATDGNSTATFDDLRISAAGQYQLVYSAAGATPDTSATFGVYTLEFAVQPAAASPNDTVLSGSFLGQQYSGYVQPAVVLRAKDYTGATASVTGPVDLSTSTGTLNGDTRVIMTAGEVVFTEIVDQSSVTTQLGLSLFVSTDQNGVTLQAHAFDEADVLATSQPFSQRASQIQ